ncbi:hypothetical protein SmJEL517_g01445 [Synchytrium microbalum]|uniref:Sodium/calcium exchanger membrane region domain-containing protein n=1 Tax=Synchytrium microbalum TaxID=1806994 RepID=A0A507CAP6_9FUNG|nr:uncharacterized protein SmJEL517_g01445 [Synchytrium microbalum]TPX36249.1 hypothetical protein SmJEL517_g01445 [Synchytrium microbalum]
MKFPGVGRRRSTDTDTNQGQRQRRGLNNDPSNHVELHSEQAQSAWAEGHNNNNNNQDVENDDEESNANLAQAYAFDEEEANHNQDPDEEFTVKDVQEAINIQHPFGLRLWKPALYKKQRSIAAATYQALHADPNALPGTELYLSPGNIAWLLFCGWWMALIYLAVAIIGLGPLVLLGQFGKTALCCCGPRRSNSGVARGQGWLPYEVCVELEALWDYARVLINLSTYVLWPFGKYIAKSRIESGASYFANDDDGGERSGLLAYDSYADSEIPTRISTASHHRRPRRSSTSQHPNSIGRKSRSRTTISDDADDFLEDEYESEPSLGRPLHSGSLLRNVWNTSVSDWVLPRAFKRAWSSGTRGMIYFAFMVLIIAPMHLLVSALCWFCVVSIPMAKLNWVLIKHLLRHPLKLSAHPVSHFRRPPSTVSRASHVDGGPSFARPPPRGGARPNSILFFNRVSEAFIHEANEAGEDYDRGYDVVLCTYHAIGLQYYKYTFDGINIILINLLGVVGFTLVTFYLIAPITFPPYSGMASRSVLFFSALVSVIPLAYLIGMAVSSITAHSGSLALGAVVNATFGSIVEVVLYSLALVKGKTAMVEGSIIGSLLCGVLLLPAVSMVSGGLKRKEHRFNAKAAGVTSAMLIVSLIGAFAPTIFQEIYGTFELRCQNCPTSTTSVVAQEVGGLTCHQCTYAQPHPTLDPIYKTRTRPLMFACAMALVLTYLVGLWFTLRTHSDNIYPTKKKRHQRSKWGQRPQSANHANQHLSVSIPATGAVPQQSSPAPATPTPTNTSIPATPTETLLSNSDKKKVWKGGVISRGRKLPPQSPPVLAAQMPPPASDIVGSAGTASQRPPTFPIPITPPSTASPPINVRPDPPIALDEMSSAYDSDDSEEDQAGGHDAPNWSQLKSSAVLLSATIAFSLIADVLIDSVDVVLKDFRMDEKFLGLTLFALVPSVTEFYNAIAFAIQGNIALSLEIGSAYAAQVALLQIPALVLFSYLYPTLVGPFPSAPSGPSGPDGDGEGGFTLIFPRWDFYGVLFGVFILSYIYIEGKSNYFKGAMLGVAYFIIMVAFYYVPSNAGEYDMKYYL